MQPAGVSRVVFCGRSVECLKACGRLRMSVRPQELEEECDEHSILEFLESAHCETLCALLEPLATDHKVVPHPRCGVVKF